MSARRRSRVPEILATAALLCGLLAVMPGCRSTGRVPMANQSQVKLSDGNYGVVQRGVRGDASVVRLLGFIPLGDTSLRTRAMDQLVRGAELANHPRALVNFSADVSFADFLIFTVETARLRADVVEFR